MSAPRVAAVVLAAGGSSRMGRPKQLLRLPDGRTLLHRAVDAAGGAGADPVVTVLGANADAIARALDGLGVVVAVNDAWQEGPGGSISRGVAAALDACPDLALVLIVLADQPRVESADLSRLVAAASDSPVGCAAAEFDGTLGAPACFDRRHFAALAALEPAAGARRLIRSTPGVARVALPAAALDVDTPEQAAAVIGTGGS